MHRHYLIGLLAGVAAAVVFVSATTGPLPMRVILFLLTPLPLFLSGFGWGWVTTLIAGIVGMLVMAALTTPAIGAIFAISQAIPSTILIYLVTLNRPAAGPGPDVDPVTRTEWYPVGRIVVWAAGISATMSIAALLLIGPDMETLRGEVRNLIDVVLKAQLEAMNSGTTMSEADLVRLTDLGIYLLPAATALSWMLTILFNLWLAAKITLASGKLPRPWPDLPAMRFPRMTPLVLAVTSALTLVPGYIALAASAASGALFFAYVLMGLAVIHYATRGQPWRPFALWGVYGALLILNTGVSAIIALIGIADSFLLLRKPPKQPPSSPPRPPPPSGMT